jgi:hypothetical protein
MPSSDHTISARSKDRIRNENIYDLLLALKDLNEKKVQLLIENNRLLKENTAYLKKIKVTTSYLEYNTIVLQTMLIGNQVTLNSL